MEKVVVCETYKTRKTAEKYLSIYEYAAVSDLPKFGDLNHRIIESAQNFLIVRNLYLGEAEKNHSTYITIP